MINVLVPNIGRRGYIIRYLKKISQVGKVYVSDCDSTASGLYGDNDGFYILPKPIDNPRKYVNDLILLCLQLKISVVIPVIDPEIAILAEYKNEFENNNIFVSVSNKTVLDICYNKQRMNDFLKTNNFLRPLTYDNIDEFESAYKNKQILFPVIIKPICGSGSVATYKVNSLKEAKCLFEKGFVIQQFIEGDEYGVDVFNDVDGRPVRCVIKKKISMRSGETDKSVTVYDATLQHTLIRLSEKLGHICNLDCDVIKNGEDIYVIDLNPRFGGGYPATHEAGVNLLELVIESSLGNKITPLFNNYRENLLIMKEISIVVTQI